MMSNYADIDVGILARMHSLIKEIYPGKNLTTLTSTEYAVVKAELFRRNNNDA